MRRVEQASLLWELTFVAGGVAAAARWLGWPTSLIRGALLIGAVAFVFDLVLASVRIREEVRQEERAADALIEGTYAVAPGHTVVQKGDRLYVFRERV